MRGTAEVETGTAVALTDLGLGDEPLARLEDLVAAQVRRPRVRVRSVAVRAHPYDRPALTTAARHVVEGTAVDDVGRVHDFVFFVKTVQAWHRSPLSLEVPEPLRTQAAPLVPWRTEADVYRGALGGVLPPGLRLPRAYLVADLDEESVAIWLESVPGGRPHWDAERHRRAAHLLGRLAASPAVAPLAAQARVFRTARMFAEHWLATTVIPDLVDGDVWRRPVVAATFDAALRARILRAVEALPSLVAELESLPTATAHGDACTDNLLVTEPDDGFVLIDFGFWGTAPIGFDLGQLLLGDIQLGRRPAAEFADLERACLPAYVQGLREEGCAVPARDVRRAHAIALTVFHAVPAIPYEHRDATDEPHLVPLFANRAGMARAVLDLLDA